MEGRGSISWAAHWIRQPHPEILSLVFQFALPDNISALNASSGISPREAPLSVTGVSRYWRDVALATPSIWSRLCFDNLKHGLLGFWWISLARSGECPLDVYASIQGGCVPVGSELWVTMQALMEDLFKSYRCRIRHFSLDATIAVLPGWDKHSKLPKVLTLNNLRSLQALDIHSHWRQVPPDKTTLIVDVSESKRLESMSIDCDIVSFEFERGMTFPYLSSIIIRSEWGTINRLDDFLDLLSSAPALEVLNISVPCMLNSDRSKARLSTDTLHLRRLRVFRLSKPRSIIAGFAAMRTLVASLTLPALRSLKVSCFPGYDGSKKARFQATAEFEDAVIQLLKRSRPPLTHYYGRTKKHSKQLWETISRLPKPCLCAYEWKSVRSEGAWGAEYVLSGQCFDNNGCCSGMRRVY
jgi:hypothetical protein